MTRRLSFILLAATACMSAPPLLRAGDLDADSAENAAFFDGAAKYRAEAANPSPAAEDKARLVAEFKKQIIFNDHGNPAERAALESMISRMMDSPTAREIAVKFIKEDAKVAFSFEDIPGSTVVTVDGRKNIWGTRGYTSVNKNPPAVVMNKLYMQEGMSAGEGTLAHEMLGHAFEKNLAGDLESVYKYNTDEEENARLIGWLVATELNAAPEEETWAYIQNPDKDREYIKMMSPYYSLTLTSSEMKDPVTFYKKRLADADKALKRLPKSIKNNREWGEIVNHFVNKHTMDPASFQTIREDIDNSLKYIPVAQKNLEKIKEALQERITYFAGKEGKAFLRKLAIDSDNEYFKQKDAVILERRERLAGLLRGKTQESFKTPPAVGQVTWDQLAELWENDKKTCPSAGEVYK